MSRGSTGRTRRWSTPHLVSCTLAVLTMLTTRTAPLAATAGREAASQPHDTARRAQILARALQDELVRRRRTPEGLGPGNGPGVDVTPLFVAALDEGASTADVTAMLTAAGFSVIRLPARDGEQALTATKDLPSQLSTKVHAIAIARLRRNEDGEEVMSGISAILTWSAP